ncbi:uracil-DNA glycosylase [Prosthecobacter vanneervenii]|uniref:Type-4 uracil-DNA glycosylase n=1 Tax=Prosthecobacter vanneervenii TaxID=48466 RepID=A0A7W8DL03_9BACT|nr:uracil-DNA glycosylase [Prosthecobacter vanneervenii]MBB5033381.1 DNA polymerase [Prosthecobacter vanneervenii]
MSAASDLLKQHLLQRQLKGGTHIALRPGTMERLLGQEPAPKLSDMMPAARRQESVPTPATAATPAPAKRLVPDNPAPEPRRAAGLIQVDGSTLEEKLAALRVLAEKWEPARSLNSLRQTMVFAVGDPCASLMLVGEAPGAEEEKLREPFVGPAGQKLTAILKAMGLERSQVYISNICKFRPAMENQGSGNRKPTAEEMRACVSFVLTEIDLIRPKVIVALGATAAEGLGIPGSVGGLRGRFHNTSGIPTMVTYHPSYILREEKTGDGIRAKRAVWEDMLKVMEKLGLPISEKQRGYFQAK